MSVFPLLARTQGLSPPSTRSDPDRGHPHRCSHGHHWQHTGPTALDCKIPAVDPNSGNLPLVSPQDCPICSGREEVLIRNSHSHHCPVCEGDWTHEGRCLYGLVAWCPWCFPKAGSDPARGARTGPHIHYCPECCQNWQHTTPCGSPLQAALPDCPGCLKLRDETPAEAIVTTKASRARSVRAGRNLTLPLTVAAVAVGAGILVLSVLFDFSPTPSSQVPREVPKPRTDAQRPPSASPPPTGAGEFRQEPDEQRVVGEPSAGSVQPPQLPELKRKPKPAPPVRSRSRLHRDMFRKSAPLPPSGVERGEVQAAQQPPEAKSPPATTSGTPAAGSTPSAPSPQGPGVSDTSDRRAVEPAPPPPALPSRSGDPRSPEMRKRRSADPPIPGAAPGGMPGGGAVHEITRGGSRLSRPRDEQPGKDEQPTPWHRLPEPPVPGVQSLDQSGQAVGNVTDGGTGTLTLAVPIDRVKPILNDLVAHPAIGFTRGQGR